MSRSPNFKPKRIYDLSPVIGAPMAYYPGDVPYKAEPICTIDRSGCNMHKLLMGTHTGSHIDAPCHFLEGGRSIEQIPLYRFMEEAQVLEIRGKEIGPEDLRGLEDGIGAVLFKTRNSGLMSLGAFLRDYVCLSPEGAEVLIERGIRLVGIDYVSIERFGTPDFRLHRRLLEADVLILEGLDLKDVPPGRYLLLALPLRIRGMDGSPVRAVLLEF
ncbi:MAG: cyclase family protein [Deltaproteobacteria bacterium]|nr:MAG: cyclase family protein [Deltaproteobacteria bacterium]